MTPKVIKTEADYELALSALAELMEREPEAGSVDAEQIELLAVLIRDYEGKHYTIEAPDPIEAIQFRMEQQGLTQRDLVPYLGSRSRVSEVLSRKRSLTVSMIRNLHNGLGIPASVLVQDAKQVENTANVDWLRFPLKEMQKRGWISRVPRSATDACAAISEWLQPISFTTSLEVLYRRQTSFRGTRRIDEYALAAWIARVMLQALETPAEGEYVPGSITPEFLREVARISVFEEGPRLVREYLSKRGVCLIVEPHLSGTHLDGAAFIDMNGLPVVGLTLRHDRLDNFWYCLMHELVHVAKHLRPGEKVFDDLDADAQNDVREQEADDIASESLVPFDAWRRSPASRLRSHEAAVHLARTLGINPAIVAGKVRFMSKDYRILSNMVGAGDVRRQFPEVSWT